MLADAIEHSDLGPHILAVVLSRGPQLLAYRGAMDGDQAGLVSDQVNQAWQVRRPMAQVQFMRPAANSPPEVLLYTRQVGSGYLLTLAARPDAGLSLLRARANALANRLVSLRAGSANGKDTARTYASPPAATNSFALAWRPINRLPGLMHGALQGSLERIAAENACLISHLLVRPELVHLVVTCPPGRNTVWAAFLFKGGSEQDLQQQFDLNSELWARGYYAADSAGPLSEAELNLFVERDQTT